MDTLNKKEIDEIYKVMDDLDIDSKIRNATDNLQAMRLKIKGNKEMIELINKLDFRYNNVI